MKQQTKLIRFWRFLECLHDQTAVYEEWKLALESEFDWIAHWLRPTGGLGTEFPISDPLVERGYRPPCRIIETEAGELRAIPRDGTSFEVTAHQLSVYEFYNQRFLQQLLEQFPFQELPRSQEQRRNIHGLPFVSQIGSLAPTVGYEFAVYHMVPRSTADFGRGVDAIAANESGPFVVCSPTRRFLGSLASETLKRNAGILVPLAECVTVVEQVPQLTPPGKRLIENFLTQHVPSQEIDSRHFFPTPHGMNWGGVRMRFLDGETLSIRAGETTRVVNYTQMGMVNAKNGRPTLQWELLRTFANGHGLLDWSSRAAHRKLQKQKNLLAGKLREFFRIEDDPIESLNSGWRTRFAISPDL